MALPVINKLRTFGLRLQEYSVQRLCYNQCRTFAVYKANYTHYKAAVLKEINQPVEIEERRSKPLSDNQVRIVTRACAVNASDLLMCRGISRIQPTLPFIPGYEVAGEVVEVNFDKKSKKSKSNEKDDDDDNDDDKSPIKVGARIIGLSRDQLGGFGEECIIDLKDVWLLPSELDYNTAVALTDAYALALLGLFRRAKIRNSDYILVTVGAGGLGAAAVDIAANVYKCKVIGVCNKESCTDQLRSKGAWSAITYSDKKLKSKVQEISGKHGADIVFETIGGDIFESAIHSVAPEGKVIIGGFASQSIPDIPMSELLVLPSFSLIGVSLRNYRETDYKVYRQIVSDVLELYKRGLVAPLISKSFKFDEVNDALKHVNDSEDIGKVILTMDKK